MKNIIIFATKIISIVMIVAMLLAMIFSINKSNHDFINTAIKFLFPIYILNTFIRVLFTPTEPSDTNSPIFIERRFDYGLGINIHTPIGRYMVIIILLLLIIAYVFTLFS
ncbi:hypothetical protein BN1356_01528 [Streptococcus varani]|uniref:Uncharacterized protein n=1 Tax=Streptococcus varani TaxID=1608583 RepID=A0A0E4H4R7_9STRE|nr:hypothetical protein [Streptococcus varani]CQR25184.1 hypothetical protein BN1356_01528 [Streptococcus varani]